MSYELKFDPKTIEHLGVKMYSTLPPALAELISNAYDADAELVQVTFDEQDGTPVSITVEDDGHGMSSEDIQNKFLIIGRNRRSDEGDRPSPSHGRLPTGKKGLGKLALFGLAKKIELDTKQNGKRNKFELDWDELIASDNVYKPVSSVEDEEIECSDGTSITLRDLKRKSAFNLEDLADSLSKIFIFDDSFKVILKKNDGQEVEVLNERRYAQIEQEFTWSKEELELEGYEFEADIEFSLITAKAPIKPSSGLRGVTIFSRGKLVNVPEFFSESTSSHFYQYLTGWIKADFIDVLHEDVISTNRQSLNWENKKMGEFRVWLSHLISKVGASWREKRKAKKEFKFKEDTGIDIENWFLKLPVEVRQVVELIVNNLSDDEGVDESFHQVIDAVHELAPEYPYLHWRSLHAEIQEASERGYMGGDYYTAFLEAAKRYANRVRDYSTSMNRSDFNLMGEVFGPEENKVLKVAVGYRRADDSDFTTETLMNIERAQRKLSQGVVEGGRNVVAHEEALDLSSSGLFSEQDCLDLLSLISHLMNRIEGANQRNQ